MGALTQKPATGFSKRVPEPNVNDEILRRLQGAAVKALGDKCEHNRAMGLPDDSGTCHVSIQCMTLEWLMRRAGVWE